MKQVITLDTENDAQIMAAGGRRASGGRAVIVPRLLPPPAYRVWALHRLTRPEWPPERWSQVRWTRHYWVFYRGHDEHHCSPADTAACGWVYLAPVSVLDGKGRVAGQRVAGQRVAAQRTA